MTVRDADLSRALSHALRHEPWQYELELDEQGWVPIEQVLAALRTLGEDWAEVDVRAVETMISNSAKKRHEVRGSRIRALYGHSTPQRITYEESDPPPLLFHGTAPEIWTQIQADGLQPMKRQYVHLAADRETARLVGRRKSERPVVLTVKAGQAARSGVVFARAGDQIWLADAVPARFVLGESSEPLAHLLPLTIGAVSLSDPFFAVAGDGWSLSVNCDWTVRHGGEVLASPGVDDASIEVHREVLQSMTGSMIVATDLTDDLFDPTFYLDDGRELALVADTELDPWVMHVTGLPYVIVGHGPGAHAAATPS